MQTDGFSDAAKKEPPIVKTLRDPIDPRHDTSDTASVHSMSQHSSPHAEDLNHASSSSLASQGATRSPYMALPSHFGSQPSRNQHISGEPNANMLGASNPTAHAKLPQVYSPQLRTSASGPLSPLPTVKSKSLNNVHSALRLDSQLLGSPWSGGHPLPTIQPVPSPTRGSNAAGGGNLTNAAVAYATYWNATSSPVPYPCGSPTAYSSAMRIMSPSAQSLRQQQQFYCNDDSSPVQLSISTLGHETSFVGAGAGASCFASPGSGVSVNGGMVHSAILDAPLQVSLVPPPCRDDYPFFSFGQSILQSTPFTPTIQTPTSRGGHSIYRDAMQELSQHRQEQDNPLSVFHADGGVRPTGHDCTPTSLAGGAGGNVSSASITPLMMEVGAGPAHQLPPRATSEASFASGSGAVMPPRFPDGALVEWTKLGHLSPPSPRLPEPLTARPNDNDGVDDEVRRASQRRGPAEAYDDDNDDAEGNADESNRSSYNATPGAPPSNAENTSVSPNAAPDNDDETAAAADKFQEQRMELNRTKRPHEADSSNVTGPEEASDTEMNNVAAVSLSDANFVYNEKHAKAAAAAAQVVSAAASTTPLERGSAGSGLQIATPQTTYTRRLAPQPGTPGVALPSSANLTGGATDFHLFMPSPVDESGHGFIPLRDGLTHHSPSEHSTSTLSLVPNFGVWQASPTLFSTWQSASMSPSTAPSVRAALEDLLEVLRLLLSDIDNVYTRVSSNEHTVRHWASCTLSALLHLTVEVSHSVRLSATEEAEEADKKASKAAGASAGSNGHTYAQLRTELQIGAGNCVETLRATVPAIQRDRDILEPLLFTSMLARGAITSLLHTLEKAYSRSDSQPVVFAPKAGDGHDAAATITVSTATNTTTIPANRRISHVVPAPAPLTAERIDDLMDSEVLARELGGEWRQFTSDYNRKLLRYLFLRVLYTQLSGGANDIDGRSSDSSAGGNSATAAASVDGSPRQGSPVSSTSHGSASNNSSWTTTLRTMESAWADDQLKRWNVVFQHSAYKAEHKAAVKNDAVAPSLDENSTELVREAFCQDFPPYEVVTEVFSSFRDGECWRCWYVLLSQMMACNFHVQGKKELYKFVETQFLETPTPPASAALHAISAGRITLEQVEEALDRVEASLTTMEEQGKAKRVEILQLLLRRIFVLSVVSSVHRALGKDAVVSDAQLATYVQVQRKSLEEVETQLTAEHAEGKTHVKCITAFLALFSNPTANTDDAAAAHGLPTVTAASTTTTPPPAPTPDPQWNTGTVGPLAALLAGTRSHSGATERSDDAAANNDEEEVQRRARDALGLVRDVCNRVTETITSLCHLLQSDVDAAETKQNYNVSPTKLPTPSTRALRRLQASLTEAHRSVMVCLASLHLD